MNQDLNSEELIGEDINNVGQDDDYEDRDQEHPIDDIAKFRMFIPVLTKMGNLMASHGMLTFRKYVSDLKTIESKVRRGQRILRRPLLCKGRLYKSRCVSVCARHFQFRVEN